MNSSALQEVIAPCNGMMQRGDGVGGPHTLEGGVMGGNLPFSPPMKEFGVSSLVKQGQFLPHFLSQPPVTTVGTLTNSITPPTPSSAFGGGGCIGKQPPKKGRPKGKKRARSQSPLKRTISTESQNNVEKSIEQHVAHQIFQEWEEKRKKHQEEEEHKKIDAMLKQKSEVDRVLQLLEKKSGKQQWFSPHLYLEKKQDQVERLRQELEEKKKQNKDLRHLLQEIDKSAAREGPSTSDSITI